MDYSGNDFYCDVALPGKIALEKEYESDHVLAFHHTKPYWSVHIVVIPKKHIASFTSLSPEEAPIILEMIEALKTISKKIETEHGAARIMTNIGEYQDSKHLHFHICSGEKLQ